MARGIKSRRFVSRRTAFFGNTCCLSNFRELAPEHWIRPLGRGSNIPLATRKSGRFQATVANEKKFGTGEFDAAMRGSPHK